MPVIHNNRFITRPFRQGRVEPPAKRKKASADPGPCYQFTSTSETPCLGRVNVVATLPPWSAIHCDDVIICRCPADPYCLYCSALGFRCEPIDFHALYALLCSWSMR